MGQFDKVTLSEAGKQKLKQAYKEAGLTQEKLAQAAKKSVDTVKRLLGTKHPEGVERWAATEIAAVVGLGLADLGVPEDGRDCIPQQYSEDIDSLVETAREQIRDKVQHLCSMMRVLDMSQPVGLDRIYTRVNILEKIRGRQRRDLSNLLENLPSHGSERFSLGNVLEGRVAGLDAVERFQKLIILGKPGAGKTTFLKYLGMQCVEKKKIKQFIPLFITLKDFAEAPSQPGLLTYIESLFQINTA
ncbi:MAG TPA: hypothetical protein V6D16_14370, partial [Candidatus Obscuribacterales bacterium]